MNAFNYIKSGYCPICVKIFMKIFKGCQFTSNEFTEKLENSGIQISRDGRGRVFDNIFIERLWRTVKYEESTIKNVS